MASYNKQSSSEGKKEEKEQKQDRFESGYIKLTKSNADPNTLWAVFFAKSNQLHLYDKEASLNEPEEIIYLSTCHVIKSQTNNKHITLEDYCVGIRYKFEPYQMQNTESFFDKMKFFIQDCIKDLLFTDVSMMTARQQFNRFLLNQRQAAKIQHQKLPKLVKAVKKVENCDEALNETTSWLQRQQLDSDDRKTFGAALAVRNKFWNLLIETRKFINNDYVNSTKICSVFTRWNKMSEKRGKLTEYDQKILVWGLTELSKFTEKDKMDLAEDLEKKWKKLSKKIVKCQTYLQALQNKWKNKVDKAKRVASWCNWVGGVLIVGGVIGGILGACFSAPVWGIGLCGVAVVTGIGTVAYGATKLKNTKKTEKAIDDMTQYLRSYGNHVQDWVEAVSWLKIPLWNIGLGDTTNYKPTIDSWEKIATTEQDMLKKAEKTFTIFRDRSLKSLNAIRNVQRNIQMN